MTPRPAAVALSAADLAVALAAGGLGLFGLRRLSESDPLFGELEGQCRLGALIAEPPLEWAEACTVLARATPRLPGPLGALVRDYRLPLPELFLLALAGANEEDHRLNLALSALQGADGPARPTLHLCEALCGELFGTGPGPVALAAHALVADGILRVEGDGPLPLRTLSMPPALWAVLRGGNEPWPGCTPLDDCHPGLVPEQVREDLPQLADLLAHGEARVAVFRAAPQTARAAAARLAAILGLRALEIPEELWPREPVLAAACAYGGWLPVIAPELGPGDRFRPYARPDVPGPLALAVGREGAVDAQAVVEIEIPPLPLVERQALWQRFLAAEPPAGLAESAVLDGPSIRALCEGARLEAGRLGETLGEAHLASMRARLGADRLRQLARPVTRRVPAGGLILPPTLQRRFDDLVRRSLRRERMWEGLGVTLQTAVNTGVRALFVGESGTGKTLAASRLATCLDAPLYRVDLAAVLNKYIGETEKNLGLLLDAAAAHDVVLLLDEADTVFGRRTDGGETGERFANMLTNFLLTRIEDHPGIVVLTSNSRARIDPAFTRRLDAILEFPLPGVDERRRLWRAHLGDRSPGADACALLASYCDLPGGYVRNAVLAAAARSDEAPDHSLPLPLLVDALREEYRKLGRGVPAGLDQLGRSTR